MRQFYYRLSIVISFIVVSCSPDSVTEPTPVPPSGGDTNIFYISPKGNDNNSGNSPEEAWGSLAMLNTQDIIPGSKILLEGGESFEGNIYFDEGDANDPENPVSISTYGTGKATIQAGDSFGIYAYNTAGIKVNNLIVTGSGKDTNENSGISFYNDLAGDIKLSGIEVTNCEVSGFRDFGIVIGAWNGNSGFSDVLIENNKVHDILDVGISSYGFFSANKEGYSHSNIQVKACEVYNISGYDKNQHSGNGIVLSDVQNSVIERSTVYDSGYGNTNCGGPVGIWYWDSDSVTIQNNEVYGMSSGTGCDGGGFDLDGGVTNGIMQYNYSHDNDGAGFMVGQFTGARPMNNIIVRYNISENDAATNGGSVYLFNGDDVDRMDNIYVYNNSLYISEKPTNINSAAIRLLNWKKIGGTVNVFNNILYATNGAATVKVPQGYSGNFNGNLYYNALGDLNLDYHGNYYSSLDAFRSTGNEMYNGVNTGYQGEPGLKAAGNGGTIGFGNNLHNLEAYKLESGSPAINAGINLSWEIGDRDFYGNDPINNSQQDIGAHEI